MPAGVVAGSAKSAEAIGAPATAGIVAGTAETAEAVVAQATARIVAGAAEAAEAVGPPTATISSSERRRSRRRGR